MKASMSKTTKMAEGDIHIYTRSGKRRSGSSAADKHPYLRPEFWVLPRNHFWESPMYAESAKAYFRGNVSRMLENVHNLNKIANSQP